MNNTFCLLFWAFFFSLHTLSAQVYTVNTALDEDDGVCNGTHCSLREAIKVANADGIPSTIQFNLSGSSPFVIQVISPLPVLSEAGTTLNGSTQPGFSSGDIILDGSLLTGQNESGLVISSDETAIYGLYIRNFFLHGIHIGPVKNIQIGEATNNRKNIISGNNGNGIFAESGSSNITIEDNYLGTEADGTTAQANGTGIYLDGTTSGIEKVLIQNNLIAGNLMDGIFGRLITDLSIGNNLIGTEISGFSALPNEGNGLQLVDCSLVQIGGAGARNIISGNNGAGIFLSAINRLGALDILIQNNYIGLSETGEAALANHLDGIEILDLQGLQIGGEDNSSKNIIAGNRLMGIRATRSSKLTLLANFIGTNASGLTPVPNGDNGINLTDCTQVQIGKPGAGNLISGNREDGILIARNDLSQSAENTLIQANIIGVNQNRSQPMGNGSTGIQCYQIEGGLVIGGANPGEGNTIGGNNRGIWLNNCSNLRMEGNHIGTEADNNTNLGNRIAGIALLNAQNILIGGDNAAANTMAYNGDGVWVGPNSRFCQISQNSFFCNLLSGIQITEGSNNDVGAPAFICAFPDEITGISPPQARIEVFRNDESCADLACQGRLFLGATQADERGDWSLAGVYELGAVYTATATDLNNNTSTFLECVPARLRPQVTADNTGPYCEGSPIQLLGDSNLAGAAFSWTGPNGYLSNQRNPDNAVDAGAYILTIEQGGCPSAPDTTLVEFIDNLTIEIGDDPEEWLCQGQSLLINGNLYDEQNKMGTEQINGLNGACDTIYNINLQFLTPSVLRIDSILCVGENLRINGEIYDLAHPSGTTVLAGEGQSGCDSLIMVELSFYEPATSEIDTTLCRGSSFIFNGEIYDENRPTGVVVVPGASATGCDSLININVSFFPPAALDIDTLICRSESLVVNNRVYDWNNSTGTEILRGEASRGCDSVINIRLQFYEPAVGRIDTVLCRGGNFTYNGRLYDENQPTGEELFASASINGCDSIVLVNIQYVDPPEITLDTSLCQGQSLLINGQLYDEANPNGIEVVPGQAGQCDTLLHVNLNFITEIVQLLNPTLCEGEQLLVNGRLYDEITPSGVERIPNGSVMGCDSVIEVALKFTGPAVFRLEETLCRGEVLEINGIRYDENNSTGIDTIFGGAASGCDSIVTISLSFTEMIASIVNEPPRCSPDDRGAFIIEEISGGMSPFSYNLNGNSEQPITALPFRIDNLTPGVYLLSITDANGCSIQLTEIVREPVAIAIDLGPDLTLKAGDSLQLIAITSNLPQQIQWTPAEGLSCTSCLSPVANPQQTTIYTLTVSNSQGCVATDDIRIEVFEPQGFYLPNAFSPNEDGENELLVVYADLSKINLVNIFKIYDRWGNLLFEGRNFSPNDESIAWDGRIQNGKLAPAGGYMYLLELQLQNGEVQTESGVIYLVR